MACARARIAFGIMVLASAGLPSLAGAEPPVTIVDAGGQSSNPKSAELTTGTRRLAWLANPKGKAVDEAKGPLALEFRETNSTAFVEGIITLVPVESVAKIEYDDKSGVMLKVSGLDDPPHGIGAWLIPQNGSHRWC